MKQPVAGAQVLQLGTTPASEEFELREVLQTIWRRRATMVGTICITMLLAIIGTFQLTPKFTAESVVMLDTRTTQIVDIQSVVSGVTAEKGTVQSEVEILHSRELLARVISQLGLLEDPEFNARLRQSSFSILKYLNPMTYIPDSWRGVTNQPISEESRRARIRGEVTDAILAQLVILPKGRSFAIGVEFSSEDPEKAALIANSLAELYIVDQLEAKFETTRRATTWLNERLSDLRQTVISAENAVEAYRKTNGIVETRDTSVLSQQMTALSSQMILAKANEAEVQAKLRQVRAVLDTPDGVESVGEILNAPLILRLREQETLVLRKQSELSQTYGERHPKIVNARAEIRDLRAKIRFEIGKIVKGLQNATEVARTRVQTLRGGLNDLERQSEVVNLASVQLRQLEREANANRTLYETFLNRFKETSEQQQIQQPDARVISKAKIPTSPSFPRPALFLGGAFVISIILGIALVFLLERLDRGIRSTTQLEELLGVVALGLIPSLGGVTRRGVEPEEYILEKPNSSFGEAIRSLHTAALLSDVDQPPKVVLVTSSVPQEGKTSTAVSLARMVANGGSRAIILDCDLRRPRLHETLNFSNTVGVVEVLTGELALRDVVHVDPKSGLHCVAAGKQVPNPPDLFSSEQMRQLLNHLRSNYDLVVIDSPPVMAVSDARILSRLVDKSLFLVRWERTPWEVAQTGIKQLMHPGVSRPGAVLSQVNIRKFAHYGYGDSGMYYKMHRSYYGN